MDTEVADLVWMFPTPFPYLVRATVRSWQNPLKVFGLKNQTALNKEHKHKITFQIALYAVSYPLTSHSSKRDFQSEKMQL